MERMLSGIFLLLALAVVCFISGHAARAPKERNEESRHGSAPPPANGGTGGRP